MNGEVTNIELLIFALINVCAAVLSGIGGSGAGFIGMPLLIFLGLSPAQAVATGKLGGMAIATGSIGGMYRVPKRSRRQITIMLAMGLVISLLAPFAIVRLDSEVYRRIMGAVLLLMIPVLIVKKVGHIEQEVTPKKKVLGYILLLLSMIMFAVFAGGMGTLITIVLMAFLGMPAIEANVTKRYIQIFMNVIIVAGLIGSGLIVWRVAAVCVVSGGLGGFIGGKIAAKKSNRFVMGVFIVLMFVSALELLFG